MPDRAANKPNWLDVLKCLGVLILTGLLDYLTGYDVSFFLFYLVPIIFTFRLLGGVYASGMCILSILTWLFANTSDGQSHIGLLSPFWSVAMRFLIFLLVVSLLTVRGRLEKRTRQHTDAVAREKSTRRRLEQEVLEATEREQRKIGHDLHDSLCQQLTASALAGKVLANKLKAQSRPEAAAADQLASMVERSIELTRVLARSLRPIQVKEEGLVDGLRELMASVNDGGKVLCSLECSENLSLATVDANMHLYRIAQEAVNSAVRVGLAQKIIIELKSDADQIILTITDDGAGLSSDAWIKDELGRQIMNYRADMIQARLNFELLPQGGTRVTCSVAEGDAFIPETHAE